MSQADSLSYADKLTLRNALCNMQNLESLYCFVSLSTWNDVLDELAVNCPSVRELLLYINRGKESDWDESSAVRVLNGLNTVRALGIYIPNESFVTRAWCERFMSPALQTLGRSCRRLVHLTVGWTEYGLDGLLDLRLPCLHSFQLTIFLGRKPISVGSHHSVP
ncbi:hypothetical protein CALCODRAFT_504887 [Calocera cornea HHB12733]|uniref:F-box domain-containing protein n=1 Tax=Calocera cornea HHB12733 TaxID=1353952 RepID=A0A165C611_9BASI|nr:hypothetical protein CALCODRAFT_504887 [Calocera cornea HHB12733]